MQHERNFDFHTDGTLPISGPSSWSTSWKFITSARPGSPRRPLRRVCLQAARSISMTAISVAGFAAVAFVPHVSLGDAPRRPRRSHAIVRCKLVFLEALYSASTTLPLPGRSCPEIGLSARLEAALRSPGLGAVDFEQSCGSWQGSHHCLRLSLRWGQHKL